MAPGEQQTMGRRKGEDTPARKRRRLPHVAVIERSAPFRREDLQELKEQCRRNTNGQEFWITTQWRNDRDVYVVHFAEAHQARTVELWARHERFAERPAPLFGPSQEERAAFEQLAIRWGVRTGALRRVVQAYRRRSLENGSLSQCHTAAQLTLQKYLPPIDAGHFDVAELFVSWAKREHWHWFYDHRKPTLAPWEDPDEYPPPWAYAHSEED